MSADLMLICNKQDENYEGNHEKCVFIDETSMGCPWHDFGKIMQQYAYETIDDKLIKKIKNLYQILEHHEGINIKEVIKWLKEHKGESIDMECW